MKTNSKYTIGNDDCHISFEMECHDNGSDVTIRSSIRCLQVGREGVFESKTVMVPDALEVAKSQVEKAWRWLDENGIELSKRDRRESERAAEGFIRTVDGWFIIETEL